MSETTLITINAPVWKQAAYDALTVQQEEARQAALSRNRIDGEALAAQIRKDLPEIADQILNGVTPISNELNADGYVFMRRFDAQVGGFLVVGKVMPDGSVLCSGDEPEIVYDLASLAAAMEELETASLKRAYQAVTDEAARNPESHILPAATQTAVEFMTTLCERVVNGQHLDPEQELALAFTKYIAGIAPVEDCYSE